MVKRCLDGVNGVSQTPGTLGFAIYEFHLYYSYLKFLFKDLLGGKKNLYYLYFLIYVFEKKLLKVRKTCITSVILL